MITLHVAREMGIGLVSGLAGTAAMTVVQTLDMKISGREPSKTPAKAVEKVFGIEPRSEAEETQLANAAHWIYGTSWGLARSAIAAAAAGPFVASLAHLGVVWGGGLANLTALGLAPPPTQWEKKTLVKDVMYHAVYAAAAGLTYEFLSDRFDGQRSRQRARNGRSVFEHAL